MVGEYDGEYDCSGVDRDGRPYHEGGPQTIVIAQREDGRLYIEGRGCEISLRTVDERRAGVLEQECSSTLPDGSRVRSIYNGGDLLRTGSFLDMTQDVTLIVAGQNAYYVLCEFGGRRVF